MDKNKCDLLVKKAVVLYSSPKIGTLEYLRHLECNLNIKLPNDFSYLWGSTIINILTNLIGVA